MPANAPVGEERPVFDLRLFEQLNDEYRDRPLVVRPPAVTPRGRLNRARSTLDAIRRDVDVAGKRVLEIGTAEGYLPAVLVHEAGAKEATGVDIVSSAQWDEFGDRAVSFRCADLAREQPLPAASIDLVISNAALEQVDRPLQMLESISQLLGPNGAAWLNLNLHRGPKASHRYREVFFPWPHLLFDPEVGEAFYRKHRGERKTFAWVNCLTAAEYLRACAELDLQIATLRRATTPIDIDFYTRFEEKLGRYPALDLETDFLCLKLSKPRRPGDPEPSLDYLGRQHALDEQLGR